MRQVLRDSMLSRPEQRGDRHVGGGIEDLDHGCLQRVIPEVSVTCRGCKSRRRPDIGHGRRSDSYCRRLRCRQQSEVVKRFGRGVGIVESLQLHAGPVRDGTMADPGCAVGVLRYRLGGDAVILIQRIVVVRPRIKGDIERVPGELADILLDHRAHRQDGASADIDRHLIEARKNSLQGLPAGDRGVQRRLVVFEGVPVAAGRQINGAHGLDRVG